MVILVASVLILIVGFFVIYLQGAVSGVEFAPSHFQQREFSFYEIPLLHLQVTPIRRKLSTPATATFLRQESLIQVPVGQPTQWHLVSIDRGLRDRVEDDANLLIEQLQMTSQSVPYWRNWSSDHPKSAAVLWPLMQKLAQRELYILMPGLFEIAQADQTESELQTAMDAYLIEQYSSLIRDMVAAGRDVVAEQLVAEASADFPKAAPWKSLLSAPKP